MKKYFLLILIVAFFFPRDSFGAFFFMENEKAGEVTQGDTFSTKVYVNTEGKSVNSFTGKLVFDDEMLDLESVTIDGGLVDFWLRNPSSFSSENEIVFEGIILNPGFTGQKGLVFGVNFKANKTGTAVLAIDDASILANDGKATNLFASNLTKESTITIAQSSEALPPTLTFDGSKNYEGRIIETEDIKGIIDNHNPIIGEIADFSAKIPQGVLTFLALLGCLALFIKLIFIFFEERAWGRLYNSDGEVISGATINLFDNFGKISESVKTNFLGYFKFNAKSGIFRILLEKGRMIVPGYISDVFDGQAYDGKNFLINHNSRRTRIMIIREGEGDGKEKKLKFYSFVDTVLILMSLVGIFCSVALLIL